MFSKIKYTKYFDNRKASGLLLADTDILSDIAKNGKSKEIESQLLKNGATLLYSLPSIMELGFAPDHQAN